ncbi:MAG: hypothetical protein VKJ06_04660 [Vampirovibrionales bacterium]|nr:hypothetical protein [Vampirovibrionales bacterium]
MPKIGPFKRVLYTVAAPAVVTLASSSITSVRQNQGALSSQGTGNQLARLCITTAEKVSPDVFTKQTPEPLKKIKQHYPEALKQVKETTQTAVEGVCQSPAHIR